MKDIEKKVLQGERLTFEDGVRLFKTDDIFTLGRLANFVREKKNGNKAFYVINMHLEYTNICKNSCAICYGAFSRKVGEKGAYKMSLDEIFRFVKDNISSKTKEIHIVGGVEPTLPYKFYLDMLSGLKERYPNVHLKAFTAVEINHFTQIGNRSIEQVLIDLKNTGLDSMPGGGADIFSLDVRKKICGAKITGEEWLNIHKNAHKLGLRSTATMLYGHIESIEDRVNHMLQLRNLQDETGGFTAFVPLAFHPQNTQMSNIKKATAICDIKVHSIARSMLDNFEHIKAYWIMTGLKMAQMLLSFGVDDIDGTIVEEKIAHSAGAETPYSVREDELRQLIIETGREPIERDALYNPVKKQV